MLMDLDNLIGVGNARLQSADGLFGISVHEVLSGLLSVLLDFLQPEHFLTYPSQTRLQNVHVPALLHQLAVLQQSDRNKRERHQADYKPRNLLRYRRGEERGNERCGWISKRQKLGTDCEH